jgi:hypothetical protein
MKCATATQQHVPVATGTAAKPTGRSIVAKLFYRATASVATLPIAIGTWTATRSDLPRLTNSALGRFLVPALVVSELTTYRLTAQRSWSKRQTAEGRTPRVPVHPPAALQLSTRQPLQPAAPPRSASIVTRGGAARSATTARARLRWIDPVPSFGVCPLFDLVAAPASSAQCSWHATRSSHLRQPASYQQPEQVPGHPRSAALAGTQLTASQPIIEWATPAPHHRCHVLTTRTRRHSGGVGRTATTAPRWWPPAPCWSRSVLATFQCSPASAFTLQYGVPAHGLRVVCVHMGSGTVSRDWRSSTRQPTALLSAPPPSSTETA